MRGSRRGVRNSPSLDVVTKALADEIPCREWATSGQVDNACVLAVNLHHTASIVVLMQAMDTPGCPVEHTEFVIAAARTPTTLPYTVSTPRAGTCTREPHNSIELVELAQPDRSFHSTVPIQLIELDHSAQLVGLIRLIRVIRTNRSTKRGIPNGPHHPQGIQL